MKLGFIGTGKIASAVITGICSSKISYKKIKISNKNKSIAQSLKKKFRNIIIAKNNQEIVNSCSWIFLSITPTVGRQIIESLRFRASQTVISFISTITLAQLKKSLTLLFGGQIGTGPFFSEIGGNGMALIIFALTLIAFLS